LLTPILEKIVTENNLTLVKVNVDEPKALELVQKYQVRLLLFTRDCISANCGSFQKWKIC
jgi:hypothetical protein